MDRTTLQSCINALIADIGSRTGLPTVLELDDKYDGDLPQLKLQYDGLKDITLLPNGDMQDAVFMFKLIISSRMANGGQLANTLYAETQMSKVFYNSRQSASSQELFGLDITGYEVQYYLSEVGKGGTDENEYTREYDLNLTINKE